MLSDLDLHIVIFETFRINVAVMLSHSCHITLEKTVHIKFLKLIRNKIYNKEYRMAQEQGSGSTVKAKQ